MANRSGLKALVDGVRAYFEANQIAATVAPIGWRERWKIINQGAGGASRVVFIPGEIDPTSPSPPRITKGGDLKQPRHNIPGGNPRELLWWHKRVTVSIWAVDPEVPDDEEAQLEAAENLLEATVQAMHNAVDPVSGKPAGLADVIFRDLSWVLPPTELFFGREIVAWFEHNGPLYDVTYDVAFPQTGIARDANSPS